MQRKMHEYEELKNEWKKLIKNKIFLTHCIIAKSCKIKNPMNNFQNFLEF